MSKRRRDNEPKRFGYDLSVRVPAVDLVHRLLSPSRVLRSVVSSLEDRRRWEPSVTRAPRSVSREARRIVAVAPTSSEIRRGFSFPDRVGFKVPYLVSICAKRKTRKEVMIAKRRKGRGGAKRNVWSDVQC